MTDTSPAIEAILRERYAAMSGSERALMALQMFETAQQIVLSSLAPDSNEHDRRRELCRRFYRKSWRGSCLVERRPRALEVGLQRREYSTISRRRSH